MNRRLGLCLLFGLATLAAGCGAANGAKDVPVADAADVREDLLPIKDATSDTTEVTEDPGIHDLGETACAPDCAGRSCGDDGCGGSCGDCGNGQQCTDDGQCIACSCQDRECGDDGCGTSCGQCDDGFACKLGRCEPLTDCGVCPATTTCNASGAHPGWCAGGDCGAITDKGACSDGTLLFCEEDRLLAIDCTHLGKGCGSDAATGLYDCTCLPACKDKVCGDDGCGGTCGACPEGHKCTADQSGCVPFEGDCCESRPADAGCGDAAVAKCVCTFDPFCCESAWDDACVSLVDALVCGQCCVPDCAGKACGDDGCGGSCGDCGEGAFCGADFSCETCACGDAECGPGPCGQTCGSCDADAFCRTGSCVAYDGDCCEVRDAPGCGDAAVRACVCAGNAACCESGWDAVCVGLVDSLGCGECCVPDCEDKQCGDNGCGGLCGLCGEGEACDGQGKCAACSCGAMTCGFDDCGNACGDDDGKCPAGTFCTNEGTCAASDADCCVASDEPGCRDLAIAACVCASDAFCCDFAWSESCVFLVETLACGGC